MTAEQRRAVTTLEGDLVVSAGAGAGKTGVLAQRFAYALDQGVSDRPTQADRLLTITFTAKAAAEIEARIRKVVSAQAQAYTEGTAAPGTVPPGTTPPDTVPPGAAAPDTPAPNAAVSEANGLWVSTIHSFCARLIRRHVLESGVEPLFVAADQVTTADLESLAFDMAINEMKAGDPDLSCRVFGSLSAGQLRSRVIPAHKRIRALGLDPSLAEVPVSDSDVDAYLRKAYEHAECALHALADAKATKSVAACKEGLTRWMRQFADCRSFDGSERADAIEALCSERPSKPGGSGTEAAKEAIDAMRVAQDALKWVSASVRFSREIAWFGRFIRVFSRCYKRLKKQRGVLDFDDLQETVVRLLETDPVVAATYRNHFDLLMVDEFQDTNALQMRVLGPLRKNNLCVVGDERQAIYGFRYADVEIFREMAAQSLLVSLDINFRSRPEILGFVNALFAQPHLFGSRFASLHAGREPSPSGEDEGVPGEGLLGTEPLDEGSSGIGALGEKPLGGGDARPAVHCAFVEMGKGVRSPAATEAEAAWVARSIRDCIDGGCPPGDIVVLLRRATNAEKFANALLAEGIPTIMHAGANLLGTREAAEISALLRAIAVPEDDEALLHVLVSRIVGLSDAALYRIARASGRLAPSSKKQSLWAGLTRIAECAQMVGASEGPDGLSNFDSGSSSLDGHQTEAIRATVERLTRLFPLRGRVKPSRFVQLAAEVFDYDLTLYAQGLAGGMAWANVMRIARVAQEFESAGGSDIAEFADYLRRRQGVGHDRPASAGAGDAVCIMTVHASKGLEFPVVYVADLAVEKASKKPTPVLVQADSTTPLVGIRLPKVPYGKATTAAYLRFNEGQRERDSGEEMRCLYVACTRAKEALVISGICSRKDDPAEGNAQIDWIREAIGLPEGPLGATTAEVGGAEVLVTCVKVQQEPARADGLVTGPERDENGEGGPIAVMPEPEPSAHEAHPAEEAEAPQFISYSALRLLTQCPLAFHAHHRLRLGRPLSSRQVGAVDFGSAAHAVLRETLEGSDVTTAVRKVSARERLDAETTKRLADAAGRFLGGSLARRVRAAERFACEQPLLVPLGENVLIGSLDLIAWQGGHALIVDYKTGGAKEGAAGAGGAGSDKAGGGTGAAGVDAAGAGGEHDGDRLLQAQCYALAALGAGADSVEVVFAFIERDGEDKVFKFAADEHDHLRTEIQGIANLASTAGIRPLASYEPGLCDTCPALGVICSVQAPPDVAR